MDVEDTYRGIKNIDMVPDLSPQNMASVEVGKDFMLSHGYIKNDFDVHKWAAPEFLKQAARELLEDEWQKRTTSKLPETAASLDSKTRQWLGFSKTEIMWFVKDDTPYHTTQLKSMDEPCLHILKSVP